MASGRTHAAISTLALVAVPVALWVYHVDVPIGAATVGLLVGLCITPDLDIDGGTHEERRRVIGPLLRVLFWPYGKLVPHRSIWSHAPILGTLFRVLYLGLPFWLAIALLGATVPSVPGEWIAWAFAGWALQDTLHWVADML